MQTVKPPDRLKIETADRLPYYMVYIIDMQHIPFRRRLDIDTVSSQWSKGGCTVNDLWDDMISLTSRIYKTQFYGIYYNIIIRCLLYCLYLQLSDTDLSIMNSFLSVFQPLNLQYLLEVPHAYKMSYYK